MVTGAVFRSESLKMDYIGKNIVQGPGAYELR